jgi:hypothetical protein
MTAPVLLMGLIINCFVMLFMKLVSIMYLMNKTNKELLCYVWHTLEGPIQNYLINPLFKYWFPETHDFYTTARNFLDDDTEQVTGDETALIPWVQSVVIRHCPGKDGVLLKQKQLR